MSCSSLPPFPGHMAQAKTVCCMNDRYTSSFTSFLPPSQSAAGVSQIMCKGTSPNSSENCEDIPSVQRWEWKRWWGSSQLPVSPGHKVGVFLPAVRVLLRPWSCPMKLVEDGTPRPGHRNPPGLDQRSSGTWCMSPKYCSFHPEFAPVLVNVSVITSSNNSTESEKIQLEMFLVSEAQSAQQSLVQGALATAVSWVTVGQNESSGSAGGLCSQLGRLCGQFSCEGLPQGRNDLGRCTGGGQGLGCSP